MIPNMTTKIKKAVSAGFLMMLMGSGSVIAATKTDGNQIH